MYRRLIGLLAVTTIIISSCTGQRAGRQCREKRVEPFPSRSSRYIHYFGVDQYCRPQDKLLKYRARITTNSCSCPPIVGQTGERGDKGEVGARGERGIGIQGLCGADGRRGPRGEKGKQGLYGFSGDKGEPGITGSTGWEGPRGPQGLRGRVGENGIKGFKGEMGLKGERGDTGTPGLNGKDGKPGNDGSRGEKGDKGCKGPPGPDGPPGKDGHPGRNDGLTACRCDLEPAPDAPPAPPPPSTVVIAVHSQNQQIPKCPSGSRKLWDGFSMLYTEDDQTTSWQDLGTAGSCLQKFHPLPFKFCNIHNKCTFGYRAGMSYWLSTEEKPFMWPVQEMQAEKYVSRCSVCETTSNVIAVHSQDRRVPNCPKGWRPLWEGSSFLMASVGGLGAGQQLMSPGSCLKYRKKPYIECNSHGTCGYFYNKYGYWLVASDRKEGDPSRCVVCQQMHDPPKQDQAKPSKCECKLLPNMQIVFNITYEKEASRGIGGFSNLFG